jgi:hypothetical protein
MKNQIILSQYSRSDLRKLAKGKISEIVGLDAERILVDLSKVLGNYESIKNNVEFRQPPVHTILEVVFEAPDHAVRFEDLKALVKKRIKEYQKGAKELDLEDSNKRYRLYANVLNAAWEYEGDLLPSEANLLRVLRNELTISRKEHDYIMAHPQINRLFFDEDTYRRELAFLTNEGIILIYKKDGESYFVLSDETVESLEELWGIELKPQQFERMLGRFDNSQLYQILKTFRLPLSGTHKQRVERILENEVKPSRLLSSSQLSSYLKQIGLPQSGKKEDKILKVIDYFKYDKDLVPTTTEAPPAPPPEERLLSDEKMMDLLSILTMEQLGTVLGMLKSSRSGSKDALVGRLVASRYNIESMLNALNLNQISDFCRKIGLRCSGRKSDLIGQVIHHYRELAIKESKLPTKDLVDYYEALSCQDDRVYSQAGISEGICATTIGLDFERATRHLFKNIFNLETRTQRFGREDPDGIARDDEGNMFCYECKTVLNPPYELPIGHRLQIRNYIDAISKTRDRDNLKGYLIVSHSFSQNIEKKIISIKPALDIPISVIEANVLAAFARRWEADFPTQTFPLKQIVRNGQIVMKDFDQVWQ